MLKDKLSGAQRRNRSKLEEIEAKKSSEIMKHFFKKSKIDEERGKIVC